MEILVRDQPSRPRELALLIGVGMIGSAIRESLERWQFNPERTVPVSWQCAESRARARDLVRSICQDLAVAHARISIAWSAGTGNFFSSDGELEDELRAFEEILAMTDDLKATFDESAVYFHFLSSAGGLFEGQRLVERTSRPSPKRAYGHMKWFQENQLKKKLDPGEFRIYRPSSVYGFMPRPRKHGLINHLVAHASNRLTTVLDANVMALRDYVYAGDVGDHIARRIAFPGPVGGSEQIDFLVSGRCASIFEVVAHIERIMNLRVQYRFDAQFGNSANITFAHDVTPPGWQPATLDVGIRKFLLRDRPQTRGIAADGP